MSARTGMRVVGTLIGWLGLNKFNANKLKATVRSLKYDPERPFAEWEGQPRAVKLGTRSWYCFALAVFLAALGPLIVYVAEPPDRFAEGMIAAITFIPALILGVYGALIRELTITEQGFETSSLFGRSQSVPFDAEPRLVVEIRKVVNNGIESPETTCSIMDPRGRRATKIPLPGLSEDQLLKLASLFPPEQRKVYNRYEGALADPRARRKRRKPEPENAAKARPKKRVRAPRKPQRA